MLMLSQRTENIIRATVPRSARNWLRSPAKSMKWLGDSLLFWLRGPKELAALPGWNLLCHPRAYKVFLQSQLTDPEQSAEFHNFVKHCNPGMLLFDIGASYGIFSLVAAHFGGAAIAIDASPIATAHIKLHSRLNGYGKNIHVVEACVTDTTGEIDMLSSGVFTDGYFRVAHGRAKSELTKTHAVTIDELAVEFGTPTHVKVDVEGHEAAVLRGGKKTLSSAAPLVFLELHNDIIRAEGGDPNAVLDELIEMKYEVHSVDGNTLGRNAILQMANCRLVGRKTATCS